MFLVRLLLFPKSHFYFRIKQCESCFNRFHQTHCFQLNELIISKCAPHNVLYTSHNAMYTCLSFTCSIPALADYSAQAQHTTDLRKLAPTRTGEKNTNRAFGFGDKGRTQRREEKNNGSGNEERRQVSITFFSIAANTNWKGHWWDRTKSAHSTTQRNAIKSGKWSGSRCENKNSALFCLCFKNVYIMRIESNKCFSSRIQVHGTSLFHKSASIIDYHIININLSARQANRARLQDNMH